MIAMLLSSRSPCIPGRGLAQRPTRAWRVVVSKSGHHHRGGDKYATRKATPAGHESHVRATWRMKYRCNFGQHVAIVGGHKDLGDWEPKRGLALTWSEGDEWLGEAFFEPGASLEYKYVVRAADSSLCYWKPGKNSDLDLQAPPGSSVIVIESWHELTRRVEVHEPSIAAEQAGTAPERHSIAPEQAGTAPEQPSIVLEVPQQAPSVISTASAAPVQQKGRMQEPQQDPLAQHAAKSMEDLREAISLHEQVQKRVQDPTSVEVLQADRILAAANNKAIAMNKALKAADAFPQLPGPAQQ